MVDKIAVSHYLIPPIVFDWACLTTRLLMLWPLAVWRDPNSLIAESWHVDRKWIVLVAILSPLAYILVLSAMVFTPVSYVAPAREMSILFAAMGAHFLREPDPARRLVAAGLIVVGIVGLAFG